ncbi:MAG: Eco57I restriction-modification methylase domain-containing protein [Bacteroidales bacterium]|nr:Eco57I restriction-modification methylase domain-containing protein [Bacteroidales bacterium]
MVPISPRKSLNKAYLKLKPSRGEIERFKSGLVTLLDHINEAESEEHDKNLVADFLKNTWYHPKYFINTKGRTDLVIHMGADAKSAAGVLIEVKKPSNKTEMITSENLNAKAFHELILYYLRERITGKNLGIKHLIVTNIFEWYLFDATLFEKLFAQDKELVKKFNDFEEGRLSGTGTEFFYKEIAAPHLPLPEPLPNKGGENPASGIRHQVSMIEYTYFNLHDYEKPLRNTNRTDDTKLIALLKVISPEHLLKLPFANDSNTLDKGFYAELLHIIGLVETKQGSKKIIGRKGTTESEKRIAKSEKQFKERNPGALLENIIVQLESHDKMARLSNPSQFGETNDERLFNIALELAITWINRILFLKLLEAQLVAYHKGNPVYEFLNSKKIKDFDDLDKLFFQVLAKTPPLIPPLGGEGSIAYRDSRIADQFANVPYLNSTLFEPTELEHQAIFISNLDDSLDLPILSSTVLKDTTGKRIKGSKNTLEYLFAFLDSYDFSSEGSEEIQEENKRLINASVLGLIFEKLNGYKDGSFFTPGFITMYMCRETIRRAVVEKFAPPRPPLGGEGDRIHKKYESLDDIYNDIGTRFTRQQANDLINSLKICDPAVGSGHFLVSALNEIIAIKSELKILMDRQGKALRDYHVEVVNDELVVTDEDGRIFEYNPNNPESQRVQETLFHEKQTLIENCLFGVDINPNSVKICRLRLWIELLKSAYYIQGERHKGTEAQRHGGTEAHKGQFSENDFATSLPRYLATSSNHRELQTLPNIDINIKCGNSLISRYALDADLKEALKKSRFSIESYRVAIMTYRNAQNKEQKREMERLIAMIKNDFETGIKSNDKRLVKLKQLQGELFTLTNQIALFEKSDKELKAWNKKIEHLASGIRYLESEIEDIKNNRIYENAFEWRFEFPEVLDDDGRFLGFDVVIGNPPYVTKLKDIEIKYYQKYLDTIQGKKYDLFRFFYEITLHFINQTGVHCFIVPDVILSLPQASYLRKWILSNYFINRITIIPSDTFEEAQVEPVITTIINKGKSIQTEIYNIISNESKLVDPDNWNNANYSFNILFDLNSDEVYQKLSKCKWKIKDHSIWKKGLGVYSRQHLLLKFSKEEVDRILNERPWTLKFRKDETYGREIEGKDVQRYSLRWNEKKWLSYGPWLAFQRPIEFFKGPRILVREITTSGKYKICATYVEEEYFNNQSIFNGVLKPETTYHLAFLLGLINSSLFSYFNYITTPKSGRKIFPTLLMGDIENFPLPERNHKVENKCIDFVNQILTLKRSDPSADTSTFEEEIDRMVYALYWLTEEEIGIVKGRG